MNNSIDTGNNPRRLFYFPIIHSQSDMGALGQSIMEASQRRLGRRELRNKIAQVENFWVRIEKIVLDSLSLPYSLTRVYQDGLPVCEKVDQIVADIAGMGSPNHRLLLRLKDLGAAIMGTESPELLIEEYQLARQIFRTDGAGEASTIEAGRASTGDRLLEERDAFIAERIGQTLETGETGLLFLGMLHDPVSRLSGDIQVIYPIGSPADFQKKGPGER